MNACVMSQVYFLSIDIEAEMYSATICENICTVCVLVSMEWLRNQHGSDPRVLISSSTFSIFY